MSVTLILRSDNDSCDKSSDWASIVSIAPQHGMVFLSEDTVNRIARLLDGVALGNGERVVSYSYDEDVSYPAMVCEFGPSLLPAKVRNEVRAQLAADPNGQNAVRLYDEIIRLGLQVGFSGKEFCDAHIKCVNCPADDVQISRNSSNMYYMLEVLGVSGQEPGSEMPFEAFAEAVKRHGRYTDMPEQLAKFVACGHRRGATHVFWA